MQTDQAVLQIVVNKEMQTSLISLISIILQKLKSTNGKDLYNSLRRLPVENFTLVIERLTRAGMVKIENENLIWIGPDTFSPDEPGAGK